MALSAIPAVSALLELDELSFGEFGSALQAGNIAEVVVIRPMEELNSLSLLDKEYGDVVSIEPPTRLPPDRGVRHEIDLVPGTKYCQAAGMVRESKSPHSTPTFCVEKAQWEVANSACLQ
ncbi:unnamed protein product [Peronospora belbahrii]|uniref:Uncharacterized protein n=1 Tax=Peronospora belbahrii TaxID=622444 RepID=A0ABN8D7C3_9STRA|nr:unnamed protein product [Peronospora belbahrii]